MDVSFNNVVESTRQYFQGLPANSPTSGGNPNGPSPALSAVSGTTQLQPPPPQHGNNNIPSSSPSVLSYWPSSGSLRSKENEVEPAQSVSQTNYASSHSKPVHQVYNGSIATSTSMTSSNQSSHPPRHQHNLPPIAALSSSINYHSSRASRDPSQSSLIHRQQTQSQQLPLPSITQLASHSSLKSSTSLPSRTVTQFRAPEFSQAGQSNMYNLNSVTSHSRSSSGNLQYSQQNQINKYQQQTSMANSSVNTFTYPTSSVPNSSTGGSALAPTTSYHHSSSSPSPSITSSANYLAAQRHHLQQQNQHLLQLQQLHQQQQQQHKLQSQQAHHHQLQQLHQAHQQKQQTQMQQHQQHHNHQQQQQQHQHHQQQMQQVSLFHHSRQQIGSSRNAEKVSSEHIRQQAAIKNSQSYAQQHQQQSQGYYNMSVPTNIRSPTIQQSIPSAATNNQQCTGQTASRSASVVKRESPLDLSVKTVRQSADSTAKDDSENVYNSMGFTHQELLPSSTKLASKSSNSRSPASLPPLQLPSSVAYPSLDGHGNANAPNPINVPTAAAGAPKVDFLPDFNAPHQNSSSGNSLRYGTEVKKRSRKSSVSHSQFQQHQQQQQRGQLPQQQLQSPITPNHYSSIYQGALPHMGSFKKSSNLHAPDHSTKQSSYYPHSQQPRSNNVGQTSSPNMPLFSVGTNNSNYPLEVPHFDPSKRGTDRFDYIDRHGMPNQNASSVEGNAIHGKRQSTTDLRHMSQPKMQKVDNWRQTIDQQIEQKLNSYASSRGQQVNGLQVKDSTSSAASAIQSQNASSPYQHPQSQNHFSQPSSNSFLSQKSPLYSHPQANNSYQSTLSGQYSDQNSNGRASEAYQQKTPVRSAAVPNSGAADKRVLSILRNSLEIKEARHLQLQQLQQKIHQDRGKSYHSLEPRLPQPTVPSTTSLTQVGRHNLPPFGAIAAATSPSYPSHKLHIPKAIDSVRLEEKHVENTEIATPVVPHLPPPSPSQTNIGQETPAASEAGETTGELDGLAAFLAARIRTKAELKQVGPSINCSASASSSALSGSNSSVHSPRTTPGLLSPPPVSTIVTPAPDIAKGTPLHEGENVAGASVVCSTSGSPPKLTRERISGLHSPRRLFRRPDDQPCRSSSETSVFDFRESDSEGEMPVLERQTLDEMRRDRRGQNKQAGHTQSQTEGGEEALDPFWNATCDDFLNQLQTGSGPILPTVKRRGRRKKLKELPVNIEVPIAIVHNVNKVTEGASVSNIGCDKKENIAITTEVKAVTKNDIKKEEESSDEDVPLADKRNELKREKELMMAERLSGECKVKIKEEVKIKVETRVKEEPKIKEECVIKEEKEGKEEEANKEGSESEDPMSDDETVEAISRRLRERKLDKQNVSEGKRKVKTRTRSPQPCSPHKKIKTKKMPDITDFDPGWEEELYKFKRSLRMPARLINIARPPNWPRMAVSLPDLDPDSLTSDSTEFFTSSKKIETDVESNNSLKKISTDEPVKTKAQNKDNDSVLNHCVQRYGGKGKKSLRKSPLKSLNKEQTKVPRSGKVELRQVILDNLKASQVKVESKPGKNTRGRKAWKKLKKSAVCDNESVLQSKSVMDKESYKSHNGGYVDKNEFYMSRTRTQTRVLKQARLRDIFGHDRPASAPPGSCQEFDDKSSLEPESKKIQNRKLILRKRGNSNSGNNQGNRPGLRSAAMVRSNKAVLNSKRQLLHGGERRKRNSDLLKAYATGKKHQQKEQKQPEEDQHRHHQQQKPQPHQLEQQQKQANSDCVPVFKDPSQVIIKLKPLVKAELTKNMQYEIQPLIGSKKLKFKTIRRKLKSSGFDYIRKKKKHHHKKDGEIEAPREKKKGVAVSKTSPESEQDIQTEIKGWVINKGLGETVLHRAARLGYTDVVAYCLEKLDNSPSPRDNAGYTPLHEACSRGHLEIARLLLLYGANVSDSAQGGIRPLHEAAENGFVELIRLLLSYGADPLLATYSGYTPLFLASDEIAKTVLQKHLADVQGQPASPWDFSSSITPIEESGNNPFSDTPEVEEEEEDGELEVEVSDSMPPHLFILRGETPGDRWVLFQELCSALRIKTRDALLKQLGQNHKNDFRDLKTSEFFDQAKCCTILSTGDNLVNPRSHKVILVKYTDKLRSLLNIEKVVIPLR